MRVTLHGELKLIVNPDHRVQGSYYKIGNDNIGKYLADLLVKPIKSDFTYPDGEVQEIFTSSGPIVTITIETGESIKCVKCGHDKYLIRYMNPLDLRCSDAEHISGEHLHYICDRCYYVWEMPTLDNDEFNRNNDNKNLDDPRDTNIA